MAVGPNSLASIDELNDVARTLIEIADRLRGGVGDARADAPAPTCALARAEQLYRLRRRRERYFDADLFGEASWDILLDLFIQTERGKRVSVSSACLAASVPPTTALRWVNWLMERGLILRAPDGDDRRKVHLELTDNGRTTMRGFLEHEL